MTDIELIADGLAFAEAPVVMADGSIILVEIAAGRVTRCWNGCKEVVCEIGGGSNSQNPVMVGTVPGHVGLDSLTMTAAGDICVGTLNKGAITTVTPIGAPSTTLAFPNECFVTNIAFCAMPTQRSPAPGSWSERAGRNRDWGWRSMADHLEASHYRLTVTR